MITDPYLVPITKSINWSAMSHISALVTGTRGSGKSFLVFSLIASLSTLPCKTDSLLGTSQLPTQIFAIDLKNADMARLSSLLPDGRVADNKKDAIRVVDSFLNAMNKRMEWINDNAPFGATAKSLQMPLYYLVIDEYSATSAVFNDAVTKEDKAMKYHWFSSIHQIMMLGRQLGFGVIIITQQASDVNSGLSSALKEEFGMKVHMGQANAESYRLTFGNEIQIPIESLNTGEGLIWLEGTTDTGYVLPFAAPFINTRDFWSILKKAFARQEDVKYLTSCLNGNY